MDRVVALRPFWDRVWAWRRPILVLAATATVLVGVIALLLPPWYRAEAEILPPTVDDVSVGLSSVLRGLAVPGVRIPTRATAAEVFTTVLQSRRINEQVATRFELMKHYRKKYMIDVLRELGRHTEFKLTQAGSIQISVEDRDRQRAADMANAYVELLDQFNRQARVGKGRRTRMFIEGRLAETKRELTTAEKQLADYQARNKTVALTPGMSSAVEAASRLVARRAALEVRLGVVRGYSQDSEEEVQIRQELTQLDRQMRALPATGAELARQVRDVKALEQVYAFLTVQYEDARISEARDVKTVEFLDMAAPPEKKARPQRLVMIAGAFFLSLALGAGLAIRSGDQEPPPVVPAVAGG